MRRARRNFCTINRYKELKVVSGKEMFKATCSECGQACEDPVKQNPSRPVYCRECWAKKRPANP